VKEGGRRGEGLKVREGRISDDRGRIWERARKERLI
jgi:hypothetical protein